MNGTFCNGPANTFHLFWSPKTSFFGRIVWWLNGYGFEPCLLGPVYCSISLVPCSQLNGYGFEPYLPGPVYCSISLVLYSKLNGYGFESFLPGPVYCSISLVSCSNRLHTTQWAGVLVEISTFIWIKCSLSRIHTLRVHYAHAEPI